MKKALRIIVMIILVGVVTAMLLAVGSLIRIDQGTCLSIIMIGSGLILGFAFVSKIYALRFLLKSKRNLKEE